MLKCDTIAADAVLITASDAMDCGCAGFSVESLSVDSMMVGVEGFLPVSTILAALQVEQMELFFDADAQDSFGLGWLVGGGEIAADDLGPMGLGSEEMLPYSLGSGEPAVDLKTINPLTERVIGCAMKVHRVLGNGFQEVIYQRALAIELKKTLLHFAREQEMPIYYDSEQIGTRRADFLIENRVLVELKAVSHLTVDHFAQIINYLEAYRLPVGLLINFGQRSLTFKRFIKTQRPPQS